MASLDHDPAIPIEAPAVREWLLGADELAFIDVREEGQFGLKMPRRATPIILVDADDGVGRRAARRLHQLGCQRLHLLPGGARAWRDAGYDLFDGTNVPSKGFAELLEIEARTPRHIGRGSRPAQGFRRGFRPPGFPRPGGVRPLPRCGCAERSGRRAHRQGRRPHPVARHAGRRHPRRADSRHHRGAGPDQ